MLKILMTPAVLVAALGYFVDIYDLLLFNIVRVESLRDIGFVGRELEQGAILHNIQMTGLMLGGIFWGMLGDRKGRLSVLFASIFLYSVANFLNGFVQDFNQYAILRFIAGFGLAGELGVGITLVAEVLPVQSRGYGTMFVASIGVAGAVVGGWVAQNYNWRTAYFIGGGLGFALLLLRIGVVESAVFQKAISAENDHIGRGSFLKLFQNSERGFRYLWCILVGVPIWFTIGILVTYAPEFSVALGVNEPVLAAKAVMFCYGGFVIGDAASGVLSQWIRSRNLAVKIFIALNFAVSLSYLFLSKGITADGIYGMCLLLGATGGYWAVVVTLAAEQFGTNLRATAATTVPNFIRFAIVPMSLSFIALKGTFGLIASAAMVGTTVSVIAFIAAFRLKETFGRDLNYFEHFQ